MVSSASKSVAGYLAELPPERRKEIETALKVLRKQMPKGYHEEMGFGMITWVIPLSDYPETYNGQPLCYAALAAQKNYSSIYMMGVYGNPERMARLKKGFDAAGKKLDMGKSCIRFKAASEIPLEVIGGLISDISPADYIKNYEKARANTKGGKGKKR